MGRRRTTEDYQRPAEKNGWDLEAYEDEDSMQQTKDEPERQARTEPAGSPESVDNADARFVCYCRSSEVFDNLLDPALFGSEEIISTFLGSVYVG